MFLNLSLNPKLFADGASLRDLNGNEINPLLRNVVKWSDTL